jgi:hypothetical protein
MVMLLAIGAGSFLITGCDSPTDGDRGANGAPGTIYLSGTLSSEAIQNAIDTWAPLKFTGVTQNDGGTVIIPAGRNVELIGNPAYLASGGGTLAIAALSSITGSGRLRGGGTTTTAVVPNGVSVDSATIVRIQEGSGDIDLSGNSVAVGRSITISDAATSSSNIKYDELAAKTLYVVGNVTVNYAISTLPEIWVIGNASITIAQTQAVDWVITGDLSAQKLPTTGAGTLYVGKNAVFAEAITGITGDIDIGGNATFNAALTTGTGSDVTVGGDLTVSGTNAVSLGGDLDVGGRATLGGTLINTAGVTATFDGPTTITGALTTAAAGTFTIDGEGAVTLAAAPTLTNGLIVTNTTGVTFANTVAIPVEKAINASAGKVIFGTGDNSVTIVNGTLASGTTGNGTVSVAASSAITLGYTGSGGASLTLAEGGKIIGKGTGAITAGSTKIEGAWEATGTSDTVTIAATAAASASITATGSVTGLKASAAEAKITQLAASANLLTIGAATRIDLGGTAEVAVGQLILTGHASTPGEIKLANATTSLVTIGSPTLATAFTTAAKIDGKTFVAGSSSTAAAIYTGDGSSDAQGKFIGMKAASNDDGLKGGNADNTITIDSTKNVTAS